MPEANITLTDDERDLAAIVQLDEPVRLQEHPITRAAHRHNLHEDVKRMGAAMRSLEQKKLIRWLPGAGWIARDALLSMDLQVRGWKVRR